MRVNVVRQGRAVVLALAAGLALAGCGSTRVLTYRPRPPAAPGAAGAQQLPARIAVLPFADETEAFGQRGSIFDPDELTYNMVKVGAWDSLEPLTPPLLAKAFAEELAASGRFRSARFVYEAAEASEADWLVTGAVRKAYMAGGWERPNEYELELRATRRTGGPPAWVKTVSHARPSPRDLYEGCGVSVSCSAGRLHDSVLAVLQDLFEEAGADLARALAGGGRPAAPAGSAPQPDAKEPVDDTIRRILEGR